jgi:hypothetical protein
VGEVSQLEKEEIYSSETGWKHVEERDFAYGYERLAKLEDHRHIVRIDGTRTYKGYLL